jgi:hypothetical protein
MPGVRLLRAVTNIRYKAPRLVYLTFCDLGHYVFIRDIVLGVSVRHCKISLGWLGLTALITMLGATGGL